MNAPAFANLLSIVSGFVAALFFCVGSMLIKPDDIQKFASTFWGANPHFAAYLRATKAEYVCGGAALCASFALQFFANVPGLMPERELFARPACAAVVAVICGVAFGGLLLLWRRRLLLQLRPPENCEPPQV